MKTISPIRCFASSIGLSSAPTWHLAGLGALGESYYGGATERIRAKVRDKFGSVTTPTAAGRGLETVLARWR